MINKMLLTLNCWSLLIFPDPQNCQRAKNKQRQQFFFVIANENKQN